MQVGISLLTLVPRISGGSETYARELVGALGRTGAHSYRVLLPTIAPDVDGLPSEIVDDYRASTSMPGRIAAMTGGVVRGRRLRRHLTGLDVVHFPLTVMLPRVTTPPAVTTVLDLQHELLPSFFSRAELAYRRAVYGWSIRKSRLVITISEHAAGAVLERYDLPESRVRPIHLGLDHTTFTPAEVERERFLVYPARAWPHKNHERLFAAFAELRRRDPDLELVLTAYDGPTPPGRALARPRAASGARPPLPVGRRARVPKPLRGLRPTAARGDGVRVSRRELERCGAARGLRRRGVPLRPDFGRGDGRRRRGDPRAAGRMEREGHRAGGAVLVGEDRACARRRLR